MIIIIHAIYIYIYIIFIFKFCKLNTKFVLFLIINLIILRIYPPK